MTNSEKHSLHIQINTCHHGDWVNQRRSLLTKIPEPGESHLGGSPKQGQNSNDCRGIQSMVLLTGAYLSRIQILGQCISGSWHDMVIFELSLRIFPPSQMVCLSEFLILKKSR